MNDPDFSKEEIEALHDIAKLRTELSEMVESEKKMKWLWKGLRNISVGIVAVISMLTLGYSVMADVVKTMVGK